MVGLKRHKPLPPPPCPKRKQLPLLALKLPYRLLTSYRLQT